MIWGWVIGGIILVVAVLLLGGIGLYAYVNRNATSSAAASAAAKWDGKTPFTCAGNDDIAISGVTAGVSGTAITARGQLPPPPRSRA